MEPRPARKTRRTVAVMAGTAFFCFIGCGGGAGSAEPHVPKGFPSCGNPDAQAKSIAKGLNVFWAAPLDSNVRVCTYEPGDELGGKKLTPFNAVATGADIVYYDPALLQALSLGGSNELGPAAVLGHEWGHELQADHGETGGLSISRELQADCIAGIYAAHLSLIDGSIDRRDIVGTFLEFCGLGDPKGYPWFAPDAHGTCLQRALSFGRGFQDGGSILSAGGELDPFSVCPSAEGRKVGLATRQE